MIAVAVRQASWAAILIFLGAGNFAYAQVVGPPPITWAQVQESANVAFALYAKESAAEGSAKTDLLDQRAEAFYVAHRRLGRYIAENYADNERTSASFAYMLFTFAHYVELSGDLWRAMTHYVEVHKLINSKLSPAGAAVPKYNGVSLKVLCEDRIRALDPALRILGSRPTHLAILQSVGEPTTDDFVERIKQHVAIPNGGISEVVLANDRGPTYAYLAAVEKASAVLGERAPVNELALRVIAELADWQGVVADQVQNAEITAVGLGVDQSALRTLAESLARIRVVYQRMVPAGAFQPGPTTVILVHAMPAEKWKLLSAALNEGTSVPAGAPFSIEKLGAMVLPSATPVDGRDTAAIDPMLYYVARMRIRGSKELPAWLDPAMLVYEGAGPHTLSNLGTFMTDVRAAGVDLPEVPLYDCPRTLSAVRFCALHVGAFARYLNSLPDPSDSQRTLLQALAFRMSGMAEKSLAEQQAMLQEVSRATIGSLSQGFAAYRRTASWADATDRAAAKALARSVAADFKSIPAKD